MSKKITNINCIYYENYSHCMHSEREKKFLFLTKHPICVYIKDSKATCSLQKKYGSYRDNRER